VGAASAGAQMFSFLISLALLQSKDDYNMIAYLKAVFVNQGRIKRGAIGRLGTNACTASEPSWVYFCAITIARRKLPWATETIRSKRRQRIRKAAKVTQCWLAVRSHGQAFDVSQRPNIEVIALLLIRSGGKRCVCQRHGCNQSIGEVHKSAVLLNYTLAPTYMYVEWYI
jgi:hypothetical protein